MTWNGVYLYFFSCVSMDPFLESYENRKKRESTERKKKHKKSHVPLSSSDLIARKSPRIWSQGGL